ncbi:(deoxy)nucleoside triphosphate pyrophosphohydrolase [Paenibacillus polymyxa]|uniref:(deoxy)nucleoside triphosphate pyrophosphohydrolase n=1 Tax=Paenibacillus polymyxa TaxID=1406 RepID=UPI0025B6B35E|nr:(deoxy)nucleoside triphosphate pyrophosphohydrolase [Paenibacillus polymyxa]MDN4078152.1 (deoxy)nucleoside triphosphate pyrophosphohydrolase [Paenibacillus polymyxa]MDN4103573.1 (deoxy)nucleoside triphosphate pyrophosphohydrolase [Paenibacillus polymyxa]MDN4113794.1 (deoxy)nucleoside triphosphate pyrophosphohydrolase [Paenibacillus polymyxa]
MKLVTAAIIHNDGEFLITRRGPDNKLAGKWEFPGGKLEPNETLEECVRREIKEELRIDIKVGQQLGESVYSYGDGSIKLIAFWATWVSGEIQLIDHDQLHWVNKETILQYDFLPADLPFVKQLSKGDKPRK